MIPQALEIWRKHYSIHLYDHTHAFKGIPQALKELVGARAVITNKSTFYARTLLDHLKLSEHFQTLVGADEVTHLKPKPEGVHLALQRLSTTGPSILIGDSVIDALTAREANIAFVGVLWGFASRAELKDAGCRVFAHHPGELAQACAASLAM